MATVSPIAPAEETGQPPELSAILKQVADLYAEKDKIAAQEKAINAQLKDLESLAAELIRASGLERVATAGKTWWTESSLNLNVLKDRRDDVLKAAEREGIREELTTVQTATLKAWLVERAKRLGLPASGSYTEGTAFAGLVSEYPAIKLMRRTNG